MKERRQYERFMFPLPVRLKTMGLEGTKVLDLNTRDLSASGAFIPTLTSFPEGTRFILDFTISTNSFKNLRGTKGLKGEGFQRKHGTFYSSWYGDSF